MEAQRTLSPVQLLGNCLADEKGCWAGEDTLSVYAAARELLAWSQDKRTYVKKHHHAAWTSAIREVAALVIFPERGSQLWPFLRSSAHQHGGRGVQLVPLVRTPDVGGVGDARHSN